MKSSFTLLLLCFLGLYAAAQQSLNLDFELKGLEHPTRPWAWDLGGYPSETFSFSLDSSEVVSGKYSFRLDGTGGNGPEDTAQYVVYYLEPMELQGQAVELTARLKCKDLKGQAFLSVVQGGTESEPTYSSRIFGTADWQEFKLAFRVPADANPIIRLNLIGTGTVWFDNLKLIVNGTERTTLEVSPSFQESEMKWLSTNSAPLQRVDASGELKRYKADSDLEAFKTMVGDARLIALGESTHGTSEFFRLKHRILEYSVHELDVNMFAIEGNMLTVEKINQYVLHGSGTAKEAMGGIFGVWYKQEVLDMVSWVRAYNKAHSDHPVQFVGYDMQEVIPPITKLREFLTTYAPELLAAQEPFLQELNDNGGFMVAQQAETSKRQQWFDKASALLELLETQETTWMKEATSEPARQSEIRWGVQYGRLIKQFTEHTLKGHYSFYRDEAMAENISWLLEQNTAEHRILIWAHDFHISRGDHENNDLNIYGGLSMGHYLSKAHGKDYIAFGMSTYQGSYTGVLSYSNFKTVNCPLYPSPRGTLDHAMHRVFEQKNQGAGILVDLREARELEWFQDHQRSRFANHVNIEYGYWVAYAIPWQFDGILFVDQTEGSKEIK